MRVISGLIRNTSHLKFNKRKSSVKKVKFYRFLFEKKAKIDRLNFIGVRESVDCTTVRIFARVRKKAPIAAANVIVKSLQLTLMFRPNPSHVSK